LPFFLDPHITFSLFLSPSAALTHKLLAAVIVSPEEHPILPGRKEVDGMGYMKTAAAEIRASLQTIELCLEHALDCLAQGDDREARGYITDALSEIKRQKMK
jgi:hypothetical protein